MKTNKTWIAGLAAGLLTGGGVALVATLPGGVGASGPAAQVQTDDTTAATDSGAADDTGSTDGTRPDRGAHITEALQPLVDDGTITQAQMDAVVAALEAARPADGQGGPMGDHRGGGMRGAGLDSVAGLLGITTDDVRTALQDGQSLADLATANGKTAQDVIDVLVADAKTDLDGHVADGDLTQDEADSRLTEITDRITAMVNGEMPAGGPGGMGRDGHGPMGGMHGADDSTGDGSTDTTVAGS